MKNREAVKSMIQLGLGVVLLVGMWAIIGRLFYPQQTAEDVRAAFVKNNAPLLTQIAENAMDPEKWAGIQDTAEVQSLLKEGNVTAVTGGETCARFELAYDGVPDGRLAILYFPDGQYRFGYDGGWTEEETKGDARRWVGGLAGQGYVNVRPLSGGFFLEEAYLPA